MNSRLTAQIHRDSLELYHWYFDHFADYATPQQIRFYQVYDPQGMAAAFQAIMTFVSLIRNGAQGAVHNAGAGVSSLLLRALFGELVICTDGDADYLRTIKIMCAERGLATAGFIHGIEPVPEADYAFYDYGDMTARAKYLEAVMLKTGRLLYADDVDPGSPGKRKYREKILDLLAHNPELAHLDLKAETLDHYGRWGCALYRKDHYEISGRLYSCFKRTGLGRLA